MPLYKSISESLGAARYDYTGRLRLRNSSLQSVNGAPRPVHYFCSIRTCLAMLIRSISILKIKDNPRDSISQSMGALEAFSPLVQVFIVKVWALFVVVVIVHSPLLQASDNGTDRTMVIIRCLDCNPAFFLITTIGPSTERYHLT